jgi:hypothetical protein
MWAPNTDRRDPVLWSFLLLVLLLQVLMWVLRVWMCMWVLLSMM